MTAFDDVDVRVGNQKESSLELLCPAASPIIAATIQMAMRKMMSTTRQHSRVELALRARSGRGVLVAHI